MMLILFLRRIKNEKIILFSFRDGVISRKIGFFEKVNLRNGRFFRYLYYIDERLGMNKPAKKTDIVTVAADPGYIHNNFIWYEIDDNDFSVEKEHELILKAAEAFRARTNMRIHELEKEMDRLFQNERYLSDLIHS